MRNLRGLARALGLIAATATASSAWAAPLTFDCDVPEGRSSAVSSPIGPGVRFTATISAVALRPGKSLPLARVLVTSANGTSAFGLQMILAQANATALRLVLVGVDNGKPVQRLIKQIPLNGTARFALELDPAGTGRVTVDDQVTSLAFAGMGAGRATAFCSSGQFRFADLEFTTP